MDVPNLAEHEVSEIIQMALCDQTSFAQIKMQYGLSDKQVKQVMRENLKPSSYRTWRTRIRKFSDRRESYK